MADQDEKVVELEMRISNLEKSFDDLSDMVTKQWRLIDGQKQMISALESQLEGKEDRAGTSDQDPPPPHY